MSERVRRGRRCPEKVPWGQSLGRCVRISQTRKEEMVILTQEANLLLEMGTNLYWVLNYVTSSTDSVSFHLHTNLVRNVLWK